MWPADSLETSAYEESILINFNTVFELELHTASMKNKVEWLKAAWSPNKAVMVNSYQRNNQIPAVLNVLFA